MKFTKPFKGIVAGDRYARDFFAGETCPESLRDAAIAAGAVDAPPPSSEQTLLGSNILPADVEVAEGVTVQLGEVVARAFEDSGLSAEDWNALADDAREEMLAAAVEAMKAEATAPEGELTAKHRGAGSYSILSDGEEVVEGLKKAEATAFNALDPAAKAAFVAERRKG